jgi:hypothetical protein
MTMAEKKAAKAAKKAAKAEAKKPSKEDKLAAEQQAIIAELVGQAVEETLTTESNDDSKVEAVGELEEEELEELSEEEQDDEEEEEEEEPTFPGEEVIEEFDHDALSKYEEIDFYVDENANVWDENTDFVGKYDEESGALVIKEDYEPTVEEEE